MSTSAAGSGSPAPSAATVDRPGMIHARPVRHPWRWVAIAIIVVLVAMMISSLVTNPRWDFGFAFEIMQQSPVIEGLWKGTIFGTVGAMILGIGLGVVLAVMRLSTNPVLRGVAFVCPVAHGRCCWKPTTARARRKRRCQRCARPSTMVCSSWCRATRRQWPPC